MLSRYRANMLAQYHFAGRPHWQIGAFPAASQPRTAAPVSRHDPRPTPPASRHDTPPATPVSYHDSRPTPHATAPELSTASLPNFFFLSLRACARSLRKKGLPAPPATTSRLGFRRARSASLLPLFFGARRGNSPVLASPRPSRPTPPPHGRPRSAVLPLPAGLAVRASAPSLAAGFCRARPATRGSTAR